ncbi:7-deoxyloganetic acid glucosyltransferase-like [Papaver somniferum]|uniref:7-deoxyloganetic acid glucosyltransferase-like n=1 Tax=Papaver somniferum TaxID=3469 RepID=UPI000E7024D7|nr:7-deoxyloganetic acid glucosyltransferase-like [Papaver somniferum]
MAETRSSATPHVLIFPFPAQGHVNSMLKLAEILSISGINVTFVNTQQNQSRQLSFGNVQSRFNKFPGFCFETIQDGLPDNQHHSAGFRSFQDVVEDMFNRVKNVITPSFRELLISNRFKSDARGPVSCIITDGVASFAIDVAEELGIPSISFRTISACCTWIYFCTSKLVESGDVPFKDEDMDRLVRSVPEMESFLRCRDLPSLYRAKEISHPNLDFVRTETLHSVRATAHILNTFDDLEAPILPHLRSYWPNLYTVGPLNALLNALRSSTTDFSASLPVSSNASLYAEDRSCMTWLDKQPEKSVVYVSFGSVAMVSQEQWFEIWYGLVNCSYRFLWVRRPESLLLEDGEENRIQAELIEATKERGYTVDWAPQEEVLNHPAVGVFLTHNGWNSTLECMVAGVPMLCWPHLADQQINSRYVSEVWKIGMDIKDNLNRSTVEKLIREIMGEKREELMKSTEKVAQMARKSVSSDGSSYRNFEALLEFIRKSC